MQNTLSDDFMNFTRARLEVVDDELRDDHFYDANHSDLMCNIAKLKDTLTPEQKKLYELITAENGLILFLTKRGAYVQGLSDGLRLLANF